MKKVNVYYGPHTTDMFVRFAPDGTTELLTYAEDNVRIHEMCGGKRYYVSHSGMTAEGYIRSYKDLLPVGSYQAGPHPFWSVSRDVYSGIRVYVPYEDDWKQNDTLNKNPTVVVCGYHVVFCSFQDLAEILKGFIHAEAECREPEFSGLYVDGIDKKLSRNFVVTESYREGATDKVEIRFTDFYREHTKYSPWDFVPELLEQYRVKDTRIQLNKLLHVAELNSWAPVRTALIGGRLYAVEALQDDPRDDATEYAPKIGFEVVEPTLIYKWGENDVFILGWEGADRYKAEIERFARFLPEADREEFGEMAEYQLELYSCPVYAEYELKVSKVLFILNKEQYLKEVREAVKRKIREDVLYAMRSFLKDQADTVLLQSIPDEMEISFQDSLDAGNCRPGTEEFRDQHFPGRDVVTAGELKQFSQNRDVMRLLRHIASKVE